MAKTNENECKMIVVSTPDTFTLAKEPLVAIALGARILGGRKASITRYRQLMATTVTSVHRIIDRERERVPRGVRKDASACLATLVAAYDAFHGGDATTADIHHWANSHSTRRLARSAVACMNAHFAG